MVFKSDWETTSLSVNIPPTLIKEMVRQASAHSKFLSYEVISSGCANLNIKITLENTQEPKILRIYLRDPKSAFREQKLATMLHSIVPIPQIYYIGKLDSYQFALMQFMPGIWLREFLLVHPENEIKPVMVEAGRILSKIQQVQFLKAGFFDNDLTIKQPLNQNDYSLYATECLHHPVVATQLGAEIIAKIKTFIKKYEFLLPDEHQHHLVHGDYDPANILVDYQGDQWRISAILDWEFAFSGSYLTDVANMLRYTHQMPLTFEESFLQGLKEGGITFPPRWHQAINLLNLLALLDCLTRSSPTAHPNRCYDIRELLLNILSTT